MDAITYSDLRRNLKTYMDKVYNDYEPLIKIRKMWFFYRYMSIIALLKPIICLGMRRMQLI